MKHRHKWEVESYIYNRICDHRVEWCSICGMLKIHYAVSGKTEYKRPQYYREMLKESKKVCPPHEYAWSPHSKVGVCRLCGDRNGR